MPKLSMGSGKSTRLYIFLTIEFMKCLLLVALVNIHKFLVLTSNNADTDATQPAYATQSEKIYRFIIFGLEILAI